MIGIIGYKYNELTMNRPREEAGAIGYALNFSVSLNLEFTQTITISSPIST